jgi:DNA-binding MarR family transcriptional regulator
MNQKSGAARRSSGQGFTEKQGQYLAFIYAYSRMFRRPPAEADMQRHFRVSPPSVHQMVLTIERAGFIRRQPGVARSIELLVAPENLPKINQSKPLCRGTRERLAVPPHPSSQCDLNNTVVTLFSTAIL